MSAGTLIPPLLNSLVADRVWFDATPDVLPTDNSGKIMPFLLLTVMGGQDQEYVEQEMGSHTNVRLQINAFAPSTVAVETLIRQARDRMLASAYSVGVYGSPVATYDPARKLRGRFQQFSVWLPQ